MPDYHIPSRLQFTEWAKKVPWVNAKRPKRGLLWEFDGNRESYYQSKLPNNIQINNWAELGS